MTKQNSSTDEPRHGPSSPTNQVFRAVLVVGILLLTPIVVVQFLVPIVLAHRFGIVVALFVLGLMGTGLYLIAEGTTPSVSRRQ